MVNAYWSVCRFVCVLVTIVMQAATQRVTVTARVITVGVMCNDIYDLLLFVKDVKVFLLVMTNAAARH